MHLQVAVHASVIACSDWRGVLLASHCLLDLNALSKTLSGGTPILQVNVFVLLATACLLGRAAASPAEASYNFTYGYNPAAITVNALNYTDEFGTALMVC